MKKRLNLENPRIFDRHTPRTYQPRRSDRRTAALGQAFCISGNDAASHFSLRNGFAKTNASLGSAAPQSGPSLHVGGFLKDLFRTFPSTKIYRCYPVDITPCLHALPHNIWRSPRFQKRVRVLHTKNPPPPGRVVCFAFFVFHRVEEKHWQRARFAYRNPQLSAAPMPVEAYRKVFRLLSRVSICVMVNFEKKAGVQK